MKKVSLALASLLAATGLSACGAEPTSPPTPLGVSSPKNGPGLLSTSHSDTTALISSTTAADTTDTTGRNGLGLGSGN